MAATTSDQIQTLRTSGRDYIVHFSARWCGPCQKIQRAVQETVREYEVPYLYLDLDENHDLAEEFAVTAVPTFVHCNNAGEIRRLSGADMEAFADMVQTVKRGGERAAASSVQVIDTSSDGLPRATAP